MINIKHVAKLANLVLTKKEELLYKKQLGDVISLISQLSEVNTEDVDLNTSENNLFNVTSKDFIRDSLDRDSVFYNANSKSNNFFKVDIVLKNKILKK